MAERLNEILADGATQLVEENFTGVQAEWWWERRLDGGIAVCQELDPEAVSREVSILTEHPETEVQWITAQELGVEDLEKVTLTFEISGETSIPQAARILRERSSASEGLAAGIYRRIEESVRAAD